jgi:hypothetical protein
MTSDLSMQEAIFNFMQACFIGQRDVPPPFKEDFDALIDALADADGLSAVEVSAWPQGMQSALKEVLTEFMARLMLSPGTDEAGTAKGCSTTQLDAEAAAAIALGANAIRARLQGR